MSDQRNDADLRERFGRMRREEAEAAPGFRHTLTRARARSAASSRLRWPIGAAALTALSVVGLMLWLAGPIATPDTSDEVPLGEAVGAWRMPTDVLLDTPGSELLRTLPDLRSPAELRLPGPRLERPTSHTPRRSHA